jgi:hypothetical protein
MMKRAILIGGLCAVAAGCDDGDRNGKRGADTSPHLAAKSCALPQGDAGTVARVGGSLGKVDVCWVYSDGTVRVELDATPKAQLIAGGAKQVVPDDGRADVTIDLDPALLRAPIASAIGDGAGISAPAVAVRLEPAGAAPIEGTLEVAFGDAAARRTRALLAAVPTGATLPLGDLGAAPPQVARGSMIVVPAVEYTPMLAIGKATTLGQLDLVAIEKDGARHAAPDCGPYDNFGMLPHAQVDAIVTVYEATTAKKVAEKTFDAGFEDCSMFVSGYAGQKPTVESRPTAESVSAWLGEVTASR